MAVVRSHTLSVGIVGLPNSGKSTLFNAITNSSVPAENYPFCTIDKNVGVIGMSDSRLDALARLYSPEEVIPSALKFVDIAGLVKGASKGEGLGNTFLSHIREADAVMYVLRAFESDVVTHVYDRVDPVDDFKILQSELIIRDLETLEQKHGELSTRSKGGMTGELELWLSVCESFISGLNKGRPARAIKVPKEAMSFIRDLWLLTWKPSYYVLNVKGGVGGSMRKDRETELREHVPEEEREFILAVDSKTEVEMESLSESERKELAEMVGDCKGVRDILDMAHERLDLITFYTVNENEGRAWTIRSGVSVKEAAGVIHSDFEDNFVAAEVIPVDEEVKAGGWNEAKDKGLVKSVGRDYMVQDGDHIHILAHDS